MNQKTFSQEIRGEKWKLILQSDAKFAKDHPDNLDSTAVTLVEDKTIWFKASEFSEYHVNHELVHAKFKYMCLEDADMKPDQMEEIFAKYMGEYGKQHIKLAEKIYKKLSPSAKKIEKMTSKKDDSK